MGNQQFKSKYFLTGFMLISAIILFAVMFFVMLFLSLIASSLGSIFITYGIVFAVFVAFYFSYFKFQKAIKFSSMAWYYVLTIAFLGLATTTIIYLVMIAASIVIVSLNNTIGLIAELILYYILYSEIGSLVALFAIGFELRELETRSFKTIYVLTIATLGIIALVVNGFELASIPTVLTTLLFICISTFYVLYGITKGPVGMEFETVEERYHFVVKALLHAAIAPIHIPWCVYCRVKSQIKK